MHKVKGASLSTMPSSSSSSSNVCSILLPIASNLPHVLIAIFLHADKQVFPRLDLVGFYSTGASIDAIDLSINQEIMALNESPCILLLDTNIDPLRKNLPVTLYETEVHVLEGAPVSTLVSASYSIETSDAERIGVDQVAKISVYGDSGCDQLTSHLSGIHSAIKMLHERVAAIQRLVRAMDGGQQPFDHALVRKISSLVHSLPAMDSPEFKEEYAREVNDALMATQLALVTKGINQANVSNKSPLSCPGGLFCLPTHSPDLKNSLSSSGHCGQLHRMLWRCIEQVGGRGRRKWWKKRSWPRNERGLLTNSPVYKCTSVTHLWF